MKVALYACGGSVALITHFTISEAALYDRLIAGHGTEIFWHVHVFSTKV